MEFDSIFRCGALLLIKLIEVFWTMVVLMDDPPFVVQVAFDYRDIDVLVPLPIVGTFNDVFFFILAADKTLF